jgi:hypothetical protein
MPYATSPESREPPLIESVQPRYNHDPTAHLAASLQHSTLQSSKIGMLHLLKNRCCST